MKKRLIILIIVCALSFQTGKAVGAVLSWYVQTEGTISDVIRPQFYIGSAATETLLFDKQPAICSAFYLTNNSTRTFFTEGDLGGIDLTFLPKVVFQIRAKNNNVDEPRNLVLKFGYINSNGDPINIAFGNVIVTNGLENYTTQMINSLEKPHDVRRFYYEFTGTCTECTYLISKCAGGFYTKVDLLK